MLTVPHSVAVNLAFPEEIPFNGARLLIKLGEGGGSAALAQEMTSM